jgi:putative endonuclease
MSDIEPQQWFVYIIEASDGSLYTGITTDMARRWQQHVTGRGARYFRGRKPSKLCLLEGNHDRPSASRREAAIKKLARGQKEQLIAASVEPAQPEL